MIKEGKAYMDDTDQEKMQVSVSYIYFMIFAFTQ
jgi:hypothetical protein